MIGSTDEKIARPYVSLFSQDLLCNLRLLELQESIEDKIGRKSPRDTAYQHRESRRKEGSRSSNSPYIVVGSPNPEVMTLAKVYSRYQSDFIRDCIISPSSNFGD